MKRLLVVVVCTVMLLTISGCFPRDKPLPKIVLIDDVHNNIYTSSIEEYATNELAGYFEGIVTILYSKGYEVAYASEVGFTPQNYAIVILSIPLQAYTPTEIAALNSQLSKKGKIIMIDMLVEVPPASTFFLDALSDGLNTGIGFVWGLVTDTVNNIGGNKLVITSDNFGTHPIASSLSSKIAMTFTTKLTVGGNATAVVYAEDSAVFLTYVSSLEGQAPIPQVSDPIPIVAASSVNGGKVVAISSAYAFHGTLMGIVPGNTDLFEAIVDW
ncbi:MAG: hypothetical protein PHW28_09485 [Mesotoga sp.]|nr:hypothetical protein [Mesotoga sp.]